MKTKLVSLLLSVSHRVATKLQLLVCIFFFATTIADSQVFWTENFTNGCASDCDPSSYTGPNGAWSVNSSLSSNGSDNNPWYISHKEEGAAPGNCSSQNGSNECLHVGSNFTIYGDAGAAFLNTGLSGTFNIITDLRAESPFIDCSGQTGISVSFNYIENGDGTNDNGTVWYYDGSSWSLLVDLAKTTPCTSSTSVWASYTQALPASADNNSQVRLGFRWVNNDDGIGDDPSFAIDDITLSGTSSPATNDSILAGPISSGPFCGCDTVNVPFVGSGTFNAGNVFTVQLSDASGSFASPVTVGTLTSNANSGTINCTIPCSSATGAGYLIRVSSSSPVITGNSISTAFTVNTSVTPTVLITASFTGSICTDSATFSAVTTNGGTAPSYQWQINGTTVGNDSVDMNPHAILAPGDVVSVTMHSNALCTTVDSVQTTITIACNALFLGAVPASTFCACDSTDIPYTTTGVFGASNVYSIELSDSAGNFTSPVTIGNDVSFANSGVIGCMLPCSSLTGNNYLIRLVSSAPSDTSITSSAFTINAAVTPSITMNTTTTTALCIDTAVTFAAVPVNGGNAPAFQWQRNGINVGGNSPIYTTSGSFMIGETITVTMVSSEVCPTIDTVQAFNIIDCPQIEIPNVFTPNGDGINDLFRVNLSGNELQNFKIDIYDRWGILMFSSTSIFNKWDGRTTSGIKVKEGTYFYIVELNGTVYKGSVMVLY